MPEKPEVMTVAKTLEKRILKKEIASVDILWNKIIATDIDDFKEGIIGQRIEKITTRGKFIVLFLTDYALLIHLRMEGKFFFHKKGEELLKHEHVIIRFTDGVEMRYHDVRKFGKMYLVPKADVYKVAPLNKLGYEYYEDNLNKDYLLDKFKGIKKPIKETLLDQSIITGIGNIYANEILFKAHISPYRSTNKITGTDANNLVKYTKETLDDAVKLGGTTIKSFTSDEGVHGLFQNKLLVHGKKDELCPNCGSIIVKEKIGGRGTYYCPKCQK